ncbi:MAG: response regulator transcription factor, partial [Sphingomonas sp.]
MRILIVEDEVEFAAALCRSLTRERFVVDHVDRLTMAREAARSVAYDLVLLDRTLPDGDGLSLVPSLRAGNPGLSIIVLSARGEISDRVAGLDEGA